MPNPSTNELLKSLEASYLEGNFGQVKDLLIKNKSSLDLGQFHYNLGTNFIKLGNLPASRYNLEKAIKYGFVHKKAYHNLKLVSKELAVADLAQSDKNYDSFLNTALTFPAQGWTSLTLIFLVAFCIVIRKKFLSSPVVKSLILFACFLPMAFNYLFLNEINYGIALQELKIKEGPSKVYETIGQVQSGSKIIVGELKDGWFFIEGPHFLAGWVKRENLALY